MFGPEGRVPAERSLDGACIWVEQQLVLVVAGSVDPEAVPGPIDQPADEAVVEGADPVGEGEPLLVGAIEDAQRDTIGMGGMDGGLYAAVDRVDTQSCREHPGSLRGGVSLLRAALRAGIRAGSVVPSRRYRSISC